MLRGLLLGEDSELGVVDPCFGPHVRLAGVSASESLERYSNSARASGRIVCREHPLVHIRTWLHGEGTHEVISVAFATLS